MEKFSFALEDKLFKIYMNLQNEEFDDLQLTKLLLSYYVSGIPFIYNTSQAKRCGITLSSRKETSLRTNKLTTQSLEDLSKLTMYKGILSTDRDDFPYINISKGKIKPTISGTYYSCESRTNAISHIKAICDKAKKITILDGYLCSDNALKLLEKILPSREITIILHNKEYKNYKPTVIQDKLNEIDRDGKWTIDFKDLLIHSHHDRYINVDDEVEIIISGGLEYLENTIKDVTYVIKGTHSLIAMPHP